MLSLNEDYSFLQTWDAGVLRLLAGFTHHLLLKPYMVAQSRLLCPFFFNVLENLRFLLLFWHLNPSVQCWELCCSNDLWNRFELAPPTLMMMQKLLMEWFQYLRPPFLLNFLLFGVYVLSLGENSSITSCSCILLPIFGTFSFFERLVIILVVFSKVMADACDMFVVVSTSSTSFPPVFFGGRLGTYTPLSTFYLALAASADFVDFSVFPAC